MYVLILEREEWGEEREKHDVRNTDQSSPVYAPIGDRICNLLVYRMMLRQTEPPGQGSFLPSWKK